MLVDAPVNAETQCKVWRQLVTIHAPYSSRHSNRGRTAYAVTETQVVGHVVKQVES